MFICFSLGLSLSYRQGTHIYAMLSKIYYGGSPLIGTARVLIESTSK